MSRNRRVSIFDVTVIENRMHKKTENKLSTEIHENFRVMAFFHPFSDTLKPLIVEVCTVIEIYEIISSVT